jgi:NADPH:quinone reductase-like Zn-dependent oxidoreductase
LSTKELKMKAVVLTGYGDVEKLKLQDRPEPTVGANELKVRMAGASINPIDWKVMGGAYHQYMPLQFPALLGRDVSGEVMEVGEGVTSFKVGDRVLGRVTGTFAEVIVGRLDAWAKGPDGMNLTDAGALPLVLLTGAQLVEEAAAIRAGQTILITGALGSTGRVAVFVAKARGATVYAGVRGAHKDAATKLGADAVVALDDEARLGDLPALDAVADTVGGETIQKLLGKVKSGGTVGSIVGEPAGATARGLTVRSILTHSDSKRLSELVQAVADGKLVVPIAKHFPLSEARAAMTLAARGAGGKVVLVG